MTEADPADLDYKHFSAQVLSARLNAGLSQAEIAVRGGPSDTTQSQIESGTWRSARPANTLAKVDRGLGWPQGTAARILNAGGTAPAALPAMSSAATWFEAGAELDDDLDAAVRTLRERIAAAEEQATLVERTLITLRERLRRTLIERDRQTAARDRRERRHPHDSVLVSLNELADFTERSLVVSDVLMPSNLPRPDFVFVQPNGELVIVEVAREDVEGAVHLVDMLAEELSIDGAAVLGLVLIAEGKSDAEILDRLRQREGTTHSKFELTEAAREIDTQTHGQQRRSAADQAGEPPVDDPDDMEPR